MRINRVMDVSFIICTSDPNHERLSTCIRSIQDLNIQNYEIIVVGGIRTNKDINRVIFIDFEEDSRGWITKKKNLGSQLAKYSNLCIFHDYYAFDSSWYIGWSLFPDTWDVACTPVIGVNGERVLTDWITYDDAEYGKGFPLPYTISDRTNTQYVSGGYFMVKRDFFLKYQLNESLYWNDGEDVEWSLRIRNVAKIVFNKFSIVRHTKWHRDIEGWKKISRRYEKVFGKGSWKN